MASMTDTERTRLRYKLADTSEVAFNDTELDDIWDEVGGDMDAAHAEGIFRLLNDAAKFANYTQNETREERKQIFENLSKLYDKIVAKINRATSVRIVGVTQVPPRSKMNPDTGEIEVYGE